MRRLDGRVAFVTGAARGQGRSHALRLAREGADIIAVDICAQIEGVPYAMATPEDLEETVRQVEECDQRIVALRADVRDRAALQAAFEEGRRALGGVDVVVANAGIAHPGPAEDAVRAFHDVIDVNLVGVWNTVEVAVPALIAQGRGGSVVLISSTAGLKGLGGPDFIGYTAAKHGVVGLMRSYANVLARHHIRVNSVHPTGVDTPMVDNEPMRRWLAEDPWAGAASNLLPVELIQPADVSEAVLWLASDEARYVTGVMLPVDAGVGVR